MHIAGAALPHAGIGLGSEHILFRGFVVAPHDELQGAGIDEGGETVVGEAQFERKIIAGREIPFEGGAVQHKTVAQACHHVFLAAFVLPVGGHGAGAQIRPVVVFKLLVGIHAAAEVVVGKAAFTAHADEAGVLEPEFAVVGAAESAGVVAVGQEAVVVAGQARADAAVECRGAGEGVFDGESVHFHGVGGGADGDLPGGRYGVHQGVNHHAVLHVAAHIGAEGPFAIGADEAGLHHVNDVVVFLQERFHLFDVPEDPAHGRFLLSYVGVPTVGVAQHQFGAGLPHVFKFFPNGLEHRFGEVFIEIIHEVQAQIRERAVGIAGRCEVGHGMGLGRYVLAEMQLVRRIGAALGVAEIARLVFVTDVVGEGGLGRFIGVYGFHLLLYPGRIQEHSFPLGLAFFLRLLLLRRRALARK